MESELGCDVVLCPRYSSGMKIVTAKGPRCGTSFVMQQCVKACLPVNGVAFISEALTPVEGNPDGYYEITSPPQAGMVQKVWPVDLVKIDPHDISALLVLDRRDKAALLESMTRQAQREKLDYPADTAYEEISTTLQDYLDKTGIDYKLVYTEDLDNEIDAIIEYLGN